MCIYIVRYHCYSEFGFIILVLGFVGLLLNAVGWLSIFVDVFAFVEKPSILSFVSNGE